MRDLGRKFQISARSVPEVTGAIEEALARFGRSKSILFRRRKLSSEALINAALLHVLGLEPAHQDRVVGAAVARLEQILAETDTEREHAEAKLLACTGPVEVIGVCDEDAPERRSVDAEGEGQAADPPCMPGRRARRRARTKPDGQGDNLAGGDPDHK